MQDYEVTPVFNQFCRLFLRLKNAQKSEQEITDRKGWLTDAFNIRGAAGKLGYDRGEALDGCFFCDYVKYFKSADIVAVIEFSGNGFPEENLPTVLKALRFTRKYSGYNVKAVGHREVPPVLLSECWNDYHQMAAKAQFDPKWEDKGPW